MCVKQIFKTSKHVICSTYGEKHQLMTVLNHIIYSTDLTYVYNYTLINTA